MNKQLTGKPRQQKFNSYNYSRMEAINDQSDNLFNKTHQSNSQPCPHCQAQTQGESDSSSSKLFWIATMAMLLLVALYLAIRLENLTDCNVQREEQLAEILLTIPQKKEISYQDTVEIPTKREIYPTPAHEDIKLLEENHLLAKKQGKASKQQQTQAENDSSLNLWTLSKKEKIEMLAEIQVVQDLSKLDYTPFLKSKDEEIQDFFLDYQNRSSEIDWNRVTIPAQLNEKYTQALKLKHQQRKEKLKALVEKYKIKYQQKTGYIGEQNKGVTYQQFFRTLQWKKITAQQMSSNDEDMSLLEQQQRTFYEDKYNINIYEELTMCIIMPTYNNKQNFRYAWSIESLLQQQYSNFKVIIIDDASKDKTAESTAAYLKWRKADPNKYILISAKQHRTALQNIYYGVHKYCDYGQIFMIVDGDDELIGRQAFKVVNALYQKEKMYVLYSQFMSYDPKSRKNVLDIGISQEFPSFVKRQNSYRTFKHSYSQLRTMISDLILLQRMSSLQLKIGKFFELLYDNALFYPAFEMACQRVYYLPEIFYWYNINTGVNDWYKAKTTFYKETRFGIQLQKPYRCIEKELRKVKEEKGEV